MIRDLRTRNRSARCARSRAPARVSFQFSICLLAASGFHASLVKAQEPAPEQNQQGVYLDDSFEARQGLKLLESLSAAGNWAQASLLVRQLADDHGTQVVEVDESTFTAIASHLDQLVCGWPPDGLHSYRRLYEAEAQVLLKAGQRDRNLDTLQRVLRDYFATEAAGRAGLTLARYRLEAGQFHAAETLLSRLTDLHPDYQSPSAEALALQVASLWWSGQVDRARALADRLDAEHGDMTILWLGQRWTLSALTADLLSRPLIGPSADDTGFRWPVFAGGADRNQVVQSVATLGAPIWSFDLAEDLGLDPDEGESLAAAQSATQGRFLDMFPVVGDKRVFFQDGFRVWAADVDTGNLLWRFELPDSSGRAEDGRSDSGPAELFAPALWGGQLIAALGGHDVPYYGYSAAAAQAVLVNLDAQTGHLVWKVDGKRLSPQFTTLQFDGAPVCVDGRVLLVARRRKTFGFEDCLLLCFDVNTGRLEWQTHLGSASAGGYGYRKPTLSVPAVLGDTVYVQSNLGTIAAVDLYSGLLRWLRVYKSLESQTPGWASQISPWEYNPTLIWKDQVVAAPLDLEDVLILDRESGAIQAEIPHADLGHLQSLLGIRDGLLYFVGDRIGAWDIQASELAWSTLLPDPAQGPFGRGVLVADGLIIPTGSHLIRFNMQGQVVEQAAWVPLESRGNVVAAPTELFVASSHRVTCLARREEAFARLRRRMAQFPDQASPCLDLAEMAFRTGEFDLGLDVFRQGIDRVGMVIEILDEDLKRRVFDDCLLFADRLLSESESRHKQAMPLYELAARCPPDANSAVKYRLKTARLMETQGRFQDAIGVYRQILTDRSLRELPYDEGAASMGPTRIGARFAGDLASKRIVTIIQRHGRETYQTFERQARELLEKGSSLKQPELLKRVADLYPNSVSAPRALLRLGDLFAEQGQYRFAARTYKMCKNLYADEVEPADLHARIIRCYLRAGQRRTAAAWLRSASRRFPRELVDVDGRRLSFAQWQENALRNEVSDLPSLPGTSPPLHQASTRLFGAEVTLLDPRFDDDPAIPRDVYLVYYDGQLMLFDPIHDRELWPRPVPCRSQPQLLTFVQDRDETEARGARIPRSQIILATRHEVYALSPATGERLWTFGRYPSDLDDVDADHEDFANFNNFAFYDTRLVCTQQRGSAAALDIQSGNVVWELDLIHDVQDEPAVLNDEFYLYYSRAGGRQLYPLLDAETGRTIHTFELPDDTGSPVRMSLLPEGIAMIFCSDSIWTFDTGSGHLLWSAREKGHISASTVHVGLDGVYLSTDRRRITKRSLYEDRVLWTSPTLDEGGEAFDSLSTELRPEGLFVLSEDTVLALDPLDGRILWEGATGADLQFAGHLLARDFVTGIAMKEENDARNFTAYFYDCRNASGRIPREGGVLELSAYTHLRHIALRDHCLIVVDGQTIYTWIEEAAWPR